MSAIGKVMFLPVRALMTALLMIAMVIALVIGVINLPKIVSSVKTAVWKQNTIKQAGKASDKYLGTWTTSKSADAYLRATESSAIAQNKAEAASNAFFLFRPLYRASANKAAAQSHINVAMSDAMTKLDAAKAGAFTGDAVSTDGPSAIVMRVVYVVVIIAAIMIVMILLTTMLKKKKPARLAAATALPVPDSIGIEQNDIIDTQFVQTTTTHVVSGGARDAQLLDIVDEDDLLTFAQKAGVETSGRTVTDISVDIISAFPSARNKYEQGVPIELLIEPCIHGRGV